MIDTDQDVAGLFRTVEAARDAITAQEWGQATRALMEAQEHITRLLRVAGDKEQDALQAPKPDTADRG